MGRFMENRIDSHLRSSRTRIRAGMNRKPSDARDLPNGPIAQFRAQWSDETETQRALFRELELLDRRISRIEQAWLFRFLRWFGKPMARLRRRLAPLHLWQRLSGQSVAREKYRRWFIQHQASAIIDAPNPGGPAGEGPNVLISVLIAVSRPSLPWLKRALDSVRHQTYANWELLVIADHASGQEQELDSFLHSAERTEPRIRLIWGADQGLASALNEGLAHCTGAYSAIIYQHDFVENRALGEVAQLLNQEEPDLLYTDEDSVDDQGRGVQPRFKPAWSPALLLSSMYMGSLLVIRTDRARAVGAFHSLHEAALEYDLVLRLTDNEPKVAHLPRVLYHRRQLPASVSAGRAQDSRSHAAGAAALQDTLARRRWNADVRDGTTPNCYSLISHSTTDSASIIVPTRNPKLLGRVLAALRTSRNDLPFDLHVILHRQGNDCDVAIQAIAREFSAELHEYVGPFNFSHMNNACAKEVDGSLLVFLNDDILALRDHWLDTLAAPFLRPEVGIVGSKLQYPDGTIQHAGIVVGLADGAGHAGRFQVDSELWPWLNLTRNVSAVTGACLAIRRNLFHQLGGFDCRFPANYNDVDLCLSAWRAGSEVVLTCNTGLRHEEGRTRPAGTNLRERAAFWIKWGRDIQRGDRFYSPNLTGCGEEIELADHLSR